MIANEKLSVIRRSSSTLHELHPRRWTLATIPDRLEHGGDPWEGIGRAARRLPAAPA